LSVASLTKKIRVLPTMVEQTVKHSDHHPKVKGLSPANAALRENAKTGVFVLKLTNRFQLVIKKMISSLVLSL